MPTNKIAIVDLESTCWDTREESDQNTSEIIEIGIVLLNLDTGLVEKSQGILIKPEVSTVSPFCTELTTITQELLDAEGISYASAYDILVDEYDSRNIPWVSWGDYDRNMLQRQSQRYGCDSPMSVDHINAKAMHAKLSKCKQVGMAKALNLLKIPLVGTHHRGIDDALNITKIYQALLLKAL